MREPSLRGESPRREGLASPWRTHTFLGDRGQKGHQLSLSFGHLIPHRALIHTIALRGRHY